MKSNIKHSRGQETEINLQEDSTVGVDIWPWVLDLANAAQDVRNHSVQVRAQLEQWVIGQPLESKLTLADIARVRHTQHSMAIARNHLEYTTTYSTTIKYVLIKLAHPPCVDSALDVFKNDMCYINSRFTYLQLEGQSECNRYRSLIKG